ncbi:MAG: hypothetical protein QM772_07385 [Ottowia sp.]|uniref:STING domain-containing protein n=1 Tax=Ottowia sp. TaxID=1898956 RepID=UPI0039E6CD34
MADAQEEHERPSYLRASWQAFKLLLDDYHWITKLLTVLLAACCMLGAVVAYSAPGALGRAIASVNWSSVENMLVSDSFRMLLTLLIALLVGVSIKRRQMAGLLDGDEHYTIGRALAYGYFKNFLVGALLLAREKGRKLYVFKPDSVADLRTFETEDWPKLADLIQPRTEEIVTGHSGRKPLTRRVVVVGAAGIGGEEVWIDFPTTLFTVGDYYASWNRWLSANGRPTVNEPRRRKLEQTQIDDFFRHLKLLMEKDIGYEAVADSGITSVEFAALRRDGQLQLVSLQQVRDLLGAATPAKAADA